MTTVLIAEDDDSLRKFYKIALEHKGYKIIGLARDGEEAISMFNDFDDKPDVIILDYRMPNKNGMDVLTEIINLDNASRIIFASADNSIRIKSLYKGAKIFLDKPFSLQDLYSSIIKVLSDKIQEQEANIIR